MDTREREQSRTEKAFDAIPGGVRQCLDDAFFTITEVNRGFLDLFGYTREELAERFGDRFSEMIHPADRAGVMKETAAQLALGKPFSVTYRVLCGDGGYKWVLDNGQLAGESGAARVFAVMLDVTETRNDKEALRLSLERHQIIMDQATDIIFEWDIRADAIVFSANWEKKFGYTPRYDGLDAGPSGFRHIHPDDVAGLVEAMEKLKDGAAYTSAEMRVQKADGRYIWCRVRASDQYDAGGGPIKAVGVISDIDDEKRLIEDLRRRAERDALTGLYNREEASTQIERYLENRPDEQCALFMIDTDNVNDSRGHLFGDAVLSELAASMKKLTRQSDVVGRIGGDEFAIFLKNISSREAAEKKAVRLVEMFRQLFQQDKRPIEVTCSVGGAMYPEDGRDFQSLYHCADQALYQAKSLGKNRYVLFDRDQSLPMAQTVYSSLGAAIDSDERTAGVPGDLVNYVFQILYDTSDMDHAVELILEIVGKRFGVSRAYIFENSEDGKYSDNTYEWCNEGILPQKEHLQHVPYAELDGYEELFAENSVFYCRDISVLAPSQVALLESQDIRSTLQCAIREDGQFRGFVGFDECTGNRLWTKEEIGMLSLISQLLTTFLQKKRATDRDRQMAVQMKTILDVQDAYIYAIEKDSYELLYINHKTRELDPGVKPGTACYRAFFGRSAPCETCPIKAGGSVSEVYNPQYGLWTSVHAAPMKWNECDAYLLSCYDITAYKRMQATGGE